MVIGVGSASFFLLLRRNPGREKVGNEAPRGAIRRELTVWLEHSRHAGRILAVRNAHPRHGGAGALYLILRKPD